MKKFSVRVITKAWAEGKIDVVAESTEEAEKVALEKYWEGEITMGLFDIDTDAKPEIRAKAIE